MSVSPLPPLVSLFDDQGLRICDFVICDLRDLQCHSQLFVVIACCGGRCRCRGEDDGDVIGSWERTW